MAPSIENLLLLPQPAMNTASSVADPTAKKKRMPQSIVNGVMFRPWNHTQGEDRHGSDENGREEMYDLVCPHRDDVFLDQHFNAVGDWLKKAERPDAIRAVAVLYPCENF